MNPSPLNNSAGTPTPPPIPQPQSTKTPKKHTALWIVLGALAFSAIIFSVVYYFAIVRPREKEYSQWQIEQIEEIKERDRIRRMEAEERMREKEQQKAEAESRPAYDPPSYQPREYSDLSDEIEAQQREIEYYQREIEAQLEELSDY